VETVPLFFITLATNIKSNEIFKLNNLNHIVIKLALGSASAAKTLAMSGPTASNPLDVCSAVVSICKGNAPKRRIQDPSRDTAIAP
jgi:hypothetical protein